MKTGGAWEGATQMARIIGDGYVFLKPYSRCIKR